MILPSECPVMLLPQCNVFPRGLLPLRIFEPRYREMLRHALATDRVFCIGTLMRPEDESDDSIHPFSTACLVRACVKNDDGTSHLILQGLERIRLGDWTQRDPFRIARIEALHTHDTDPDHSAALAARLLEQVLTLVKGDSPMGRQLATQLKQLNDPALLADFVSAHFISCAEARLPLLGMTCLTSRLQYILHSLPDTAC